MKTSTSVEQGDRLASLGRMRGQYMFQRYWLTALLILGGASCLLFVCIYFRQAEVRLGRIREIRTTLGRQLDEAKHTRQQLKEQIGKTSSYSNMEEMAKNVGFIYPYETAYQVNSDSRK